MSQTLADADPLTQRRHAFLLHQLANAPEGGLTAGAANKIPAAIQKELGLTPAIAARLREELEGDWRLSYTPVKGSKRIAITEAGRERLRVLGRFVPLQPARGERIEVEEPARPAVSPTCCCNSCRFLKAGPRHPC